MSVTVAMLLTMAHHTILPPAIVTDRAQAILARSAEEVVDSTCTSSTGTLRQTSRRQ